MLANSFESNLSVRPGVATDVLFVVLRHMSDVQLDEASPRVIVLEMTRVRIDKVKDLMRAMIVSC